MKKLLEHLSVNKDNINEIEQKTKAQSNSEDSEWKKKRQFRITASNFGLVMKRQRHHEYLADNLLHPKPFSSRYTAHGNKYEPTALAEYQKYMYTGVIRRHLQDLGWLGLALRCRWAIPHET
jgi:hypothetical protein